MLVLSRKIGQQIIIAGNIRVVVLNVHGDRVKLGFEGPDDVPIHREEVHHRIVRGKAVNMQMADAPSSCVPSGP